MVRFQANPASSLSLADQVASHFRQLIGENVLSEGDLLPPADQIPNASRPIVLDGYRKLQQEGLVKVRRARGTVVTAGRNRQCLGILLRPTEDNHYLDPYRQTIINTLMQEAVDDGNVPRVYMMGPYHPDPEQVLPATFKADLARNEISGVFVQPFKKDRGVLSWLEARHMPYVLISQDQAGPVVGPDQRQMLTDGVRLLLASGCQRLLVWSTCAEHSYDDIRADVGGLPPSVSIDWMSEFVDSKTLVSQGLRLSQKVLALPPERRFDGILVTDDWVALNAYIELRANGVRIPEHLHVAVACNAGTPKDCFRGCDRLVVEPREIVTGMVELLRKRRAYPGESCEEVLIPYRLLEDGV